MKVKKSLVVAGAVATMGLAGIAGMGIVSAATSPDGKANNLADKIAVKFNLDRGEVEAVFEEERTAQKAEAEQNMEARLNKAVADGKITEQQKAKILAKHAELRAEMEADKETFKDKTKEEMRSLLQQRQEALTQWANENNVPLEYLRFVAAFHGGPVGPMDQGVNRPAMEVRTDSAN